MNRLHVTPLLGICLFALLGGCATRPVNPPITQADPSSGYRFEVRQAHTMAAGKEAMVILAFSGGGTRAAAFSYGVLEFLAAHEDRQLPGQERSAAGRGRHHHRRLRRQLHGAGVRAVRREAVRRLRDPVPEAQRPGRDRRAHAQSGQLGRLSSTGWGRSELAAQLYDEILFNGATFGDLNRGNGPLILASATDLSTGSRFVFNQSTFDVICSDLNAVPLSRAASASSAVPVVLSAVTLNNYGGTCNMTTPPWAVPFLDSADPPRPAARAIRTLKSIRAYGDGVNRPFLHLVDGGVADNLGMRAVLDTMEVLEALNEIRRCAPRSTTCAGSSCSSSTRSPSRRRTGTGPRTPPGTVATLLKASGTPIDRNSFETVEQLSDTSAKWRTMRLIADSRAMASNTDPAVAKAAARSERGDLRDRRLVRRAGRQGGVRLPEPAADFVRAAGGSSRSAACRRRKDHHGVTRIQSTAEGPRCQSCH